LLSTLSSTTELYPLSLHDALPILAEGSPALGASFFGKAIYTSEDLQQLSAVATQVVSLNLSGMPLTDTDAEILRTFVNLRELVLDRKSTRLNSSHVKISYAVFCLK